MNNQPIEKKVYRNGGALEVHSIFYTIQGEGPHTGKPAIFIRLAGCNLQCPGCDTDYTSTRRIMSPIAVRCEVDILKNDEWEVAPRPLVVITGGEPFRQDISVLCMLLLQGAYPVQVETNGTLPPPPNLSPKVEIVCSPKAGRINEELQPRITALKYVVQADKIERKDGLPTRVLEHPAAPVVAKPWPGYTGPIYIQPMDEGDIRTNRRNLQAAINSCMQHGHTLQLQIHKTIGLE